jgi:hypothetical protein
MNHKYAAKLNLDLKLFKSDLHPVEFLKNLIPEDANDYTKNIHYRLPHKLVSDELKEFFIKHGKLFGFIEIFYIPPNSNLGLHTDEHVTGSYGKINWVFSGKDSQMIWYDLKDPSVNGKIQNTYINTPSISYKIEDLIFKYAEHLEGPNLVEVGCPHTVVTREEERWCVSTIFVNEYIHYTRPNMEESIEIFKDYI